MKNTQSFRELMQAHGMQVPGIKVHFSIDNAAEAFKIAFTEFVPTYQHIKEYDEVIKWLSNNEGKGLFMYGTRGRGKTIIAKYVIPALLLAYHSKVVNYYDIQDFKTKYDEIITKKIIALDDIGTEEVIVNYGNRVEPFSEIMDIVEKKSKMIIITSNITEKQLIERYGMRILDRLKATTTRVLFTGESFR